MFFGFFRKSIGQPARVGVGYAKRISLGLPGIIGILFGLAALDFLVRLAIEFLK